MSATTSRVPQEERTRLMRARLLEAAVEVLLERGFANTTTTLVSERAGVSRGAQLHHFPTKNELVVAAVAHVMERRAEDLRAAVADHRGAPIPKVIRMLGDYFASPGFQAALELWVAARTDTELHAVVAPFERHLGRETHRLTVDLLGADESRPGVRELIQATLDLCRGLGLADTLSNDARRRARVLDEWAKVLEKELR